MFLLDTNIISESRKRKPHGAVLAWLQAQAEADLYLAAITLGELQAGIELTRKQDSGKARELEDWLDRVEASAQVLPADGRVFREWARLMEGRPDHLIEDALIAATARVHRLTVVTRNVRDFASFQVRTVNPFEFTGGAGAR
jgi:hypothetical protein